METRKQFADLADQLADLQALKPKSKEELAHWYQRAREVQDSLGSPGGLGASVPEFLWHYLSDADIRANDEGYARIHESQLAILIEFLKRGSMASGKDLDVDAQVTPRAPRAST
jgi:hypothetical protein